MPKTLALVICLVLAGAMAWAASRSPAPLPSDAAPEAFSAGRAMSDIQIIAAHPHPIGSVEHDRVRDYILQRFASLGLKAEIHAGRAFEVEGPGEVFGGEVQNIVAVMHGRDPAAPAVAVTAHYDTVPASPGAADDTVGVASALEIARALNASGSPARDVVFLITDGEEAGLLGARAFYARDPLAGHVGAVLNMESRGGGGRVYMFETGASSGNMVRLFQKTAVNPTSNSLASYVYSKMPNDTDFTVSKAKGIGGLNYAFIGRPFDYHAASSTLAALDRGSVQHMGEQVLAAARALADATALPAKAADAVHFDLLGWAVIFYPAWGGWLVLAVAAGLAGTALRRAFRDEPFSILDLLRGAGALVLTTIAAAALMHLARMAVNIPHSFEGQRPLLAQFGLYETALAALGLGSAVLAFFVAGIGRTRYWSAFAGALCVMLVLALAAQALAPLTAFLLAWPLLFAAAIAACLTFRWHGAWSRWSGLAFTALTGALVLAELIYIAHPVALGVGADLPEAAAAFVLIGALVLFPLLWPRSGERLTPALGALALIAGVILVLVVRLHDPASARYPRPSYAAYVADGGSGKFWRVIGYTDDWSREVLGGDGASPRKTNLPPLAVPGFMGAAKPVVVSQPKASITHAPDGRVSITLTPAGPAREARLRFSVQGPVGRATINGLPADLQGDGRPNHAAWAHPDQGLTIAFDARPGAAIDARYLVMLDAWPADARPLPPRPAGLMPWGNSDTTLLIGPVKPVG